jgi:type IV pilus assembly protein PilN
MILINLLPHREERRKRRKQAFFVGLGVAAAVGLGVVAVWYLVLQQMIAAQQDRNAFLTAEIRKLESQIKDIASLRAEIDALKARQKVVEDFQIDRNMPVHMLNELVAQTPEGVYFSSIKQDGQTITVTGIAQTNERVSEFLRNTAYNSPWLQRPELVEIKATNVTLANKDQKRLFDFSVRLTLQRPQDKDKATTAPKNTPVGGLQPATAPGAPGTPASAAALKQS